MVKIVISGDMSPEEIEEVIGAAMAPMKRVIQQIAKLAAASTAQAADVDLVKEVGRSLALDAEAQQPVIKPTPRRRKKN